MNPKLYVWYFLHDKPKFWSDTRRKLHILTLEKSEYYSECVQFYDFLDVKDKIVFDVGCDFGTTPMYFIHKGAIKVIGFSKDTQYFQDYRYKHFNVNKDPSPLFNIITEIESIKRSMDKQIVLKSDCEGCEWNFTKEFIDSFEDWIIAIHTPIKNNELYEYIKANGDLIGRQEGSEIGVYHKKRINIAKEIVKLYSEDRDYKVQYFNEHINSDHKSMQEKIQEINNEMNSRCGIKW